MWMREHMPVKTYFCPPMHWDVYELSNFDCSKRDCIWKVLKGRYIHFTPDYIEVYDPGDEIPDPRYTSSKFTLKVGGNYRKRFYISAPKYLCVAEDGHTFFFAKDDDDLEKRFADCSGSQVLQSRIEHLTSELEEMGKRLSMLEQMLAKGEPEKEAVEREVPEQGVQSFDDVEQPLPGVTFEKSKGKWRVRVYVNGKRKHGGYFNTVEEANDAKLKLLESFLK